MISSLIRRIGERGWSDPAMVGPSVVVPVPAWIFTSICGSSEPGFGYGCARSAGHTGRHACYYLSDATGNKGRVLAVWA